MIRLRNDWRLQASCKDAAPEDYFPQTRPSRAQLAACERCPVRTECLEFALASPWKPEGIWAGLTPPKIQAEWRKHHRGSKELV